MEVRRAAADILGRIPGAGPDAVADLLTVLQNEPSSDAGAAAADALGAIGGDEAAPALVKFLQGQHESAARQRVAGVLGKIIAEAAQAQLAAQGQGPALPAEVERRLAEGRAQLLVRLQAAKEKDPGVRAAAAEAVHAYLGILNLTLSKQDVAILVEALRDEDPEVRRQAALALSAGAFGTDAYDAIEPLLQLLDNGPLPGSLAAAAALSRIGGYAEINRVQDRLRTLLRASNDPADQEAILAAIEEAPLGGDADMASAIAGLLESPAPGVRLQAAKALGSLGPAAKSSIADLIEALRCEQATAAGRSALEAAVGALGARRLDDEKRPTPEAMIEALRKIGPDAKEAVPDLGAMVRAGLTWKLRSAAAQALQAIGPDARDAVADLREALADTNAEVRSEAAEALGALRKDGKGAIDDLCKALREDDDPGVKEAAADALEEIGPEAGAAADTAAVALGAALREAKNDRLQLAITRALHSLGKASVPVLARAMRQDKEKNVRRAAAETLGGMGPAAAGALPDLIVALGQDPDEIVRAAAATAVGAVGTTDLQTALPALQKALEGDRPPTVQRAAAEAIGNIGHDAQAAIPELVRAMGADRPAEVREAAVRALAVFQADARPVVPQLGQVLRDDKVASVWRAAADAIAATGPSHDAFAELLSALPGADMQRRLGVLFGDSQRRLAAAQALGSLAGRIPEDGSADALLHDLEETERTLTDMQESLQSEALLAIDPDTLTLFKERALTPVHQALEAMRARIAAAEAAVNAAIDAAHHRDMEERQFAMILWLTVAIVALVAVLGSWATISIRQPQWFMRVNGLLARFYDAIRLPGFLRLLIPIGWPSAAAQRQMADLLAQLREERAKRAAEQAKLKADLLHAKDELKPLYPDSFQSDRHGVAIVHRRRQAEVVGGDFYHFLSMECGAVGIYVVDVEGHGLQASRHARELYLVLSRDGWGKAGNCCVQLRKADDMVRGVALFKEAGTAFCMNFLKVDAARGCVQHANAGMPYPRLYRQGRLQRELEAGGLWVGEGYGAVIPAEQVEADFQDDDLLVIVSDGILEAADRRGNLFGAAGVDKVVWSCRGATLEATADEVLHAAMRHAARTGPEDDQTVILVRLHKRGAVAPVTPDREQGP
jgi:HEAT repeat protein